MPPLVAPFRVSEYDATGASYVRTFWRVPSSADTVSKADTVPVEPTLLQLTVVVVVHDVVAQTFSSPTAIVGV